MFPKTDLEKKLNVQIATSAIMDDAIDRWMAMYKNQAYWIGGPRHIKSLNLPSTIAEEFARLILTEFDLKVEGSPRADFIYQQMGNFLSTISNTVELFCALGGVILKPYVAGENENGLPEKICIDVIPANRFRPTDFNSNKEITGAIFIDSKRIGDYIYTRIERHKLDGYHYTVENKAFRSERIYTSSSDDELDTFTCQNPFTEEVPLTSVDEWAGIDAVVEMDDVERPFFVYIRQPRANNIDPLSPLGVSVYSRAEETIRQCDKMFSRILWEYRGTELAVHADESIFGVDSRGHVVMPEGDDRLYRTFDFDGTDKKGFIETFSPEIRDSSLFNGLNQLFRRVESQSGLAYGTLSDVSEVEKTAEEVRQSKQRSYSSVNAQQSSFGHGIETLIDVMNTLCDIYHIGSIGVVNVAITWGDGVLEDTDVEFQRRWAMVTAGKLKLEKFFAWYFNCTEEEAMELIPEQKPEDEAAFGTE